MVQEYLRPSDIRFTQDSIKESFTDGRPLKETFTALAQGWLTVDQITRVACVKFSDQYWIIHGNRRLYLYKILEEVGKIDYIRVNILGLRPEAFFDKLTTKNNGGLPVCRQNKNLFQELMRIARPRIQRADDDLIVSNLSAGSSYRNASTTPSHQRSYYQETRPQPTYNTTQSRNASTTPSHQRSYYQETRPQPTYNTTQSRRVEEDNCDGCSCWKCTIL